MDWTPQPYNHGLLRNPWASQLERATVKFKGRRRKAAGAAGAVLRCLLQGFRIHDVPINNLYFKVLTPRFPLKNQTPEAVHPLPWQGEANLDRASPAEAPTGADWKDPAPADLSQDGHSVSADPSRYRSVPALPFHTGCLPFHSGHVGGWTTHVKEGGACLQHCWRGGLWGLTGGSCQPGTCHCLQGSCSWTCLLPRSWGRGSRDGGTKEETEMHLPSCDTLVCRNS